MKGVLTWIGAIAVGYVLFNSIARSVANNLSLVKATVKVGSLSFSGISLKVNLHIKNNTALAIPVDGFSGFVHYGINPIAPVDIRKSYVIQPQAISIITIDSLIEFSKLSTAISDIIKSGEYLNALKLKGQLAYESISIPIDINLNPFNA
ncbi:MAG: hypothetical protein IPK91_02650 [Saprospiraceae bacterium]|nr:hypothetical protein [Saprospiraceae bacterium]MBK8296189.1 hypothetical protein [Saprospiraceae bacterium]